MKKTFLFYDIETTGLNKAFDQVLQFASIRTDEKFHETERHNIRIALRPDVIPSPEAVMTHRIFGTDKNELCELDAMKKIHNLMNRPGTTSVGYNSLGFDDEFLRFSFYRNLLTPYTHQYASGCGRMDIFAAVIFYFYYKQDVIKWPEKDGKPTLKLEEINRVNGFSSGMSHDALADVEATLGLARKLSSSGDVWAYISGYFSKSDDSSRVEKLPVVFESQFGRHRAGIMVSRDFGYTGTHHAPVLLLGGSVPYRNQTLWLRMDLPEIMAATPENVHETTRVARKRLGEPGFLLPASERFIKNISSERMRTASGNLGWLKANPEIFAAIVKYHSNFRYPEVPDVDADAALYANGFFSKQTEETARKFLHEPYESKLSVLHEFTDETTRKLARRILFRNYPESLSIPEVKKEYEECIESLISENDEKNPVDHRGEKKLTPSNALGVIDDIFSGRSWKVPDETEKKLLNDLKAFLSSRFIREIPKNQNF